jgi:hypothetical protein
MSYTKSMKAWARGAGSLGESTSRRVKSKKYGAPRLSEAECLKVAEAIRTRGRSYAAALHGRTIVDWVDGEMSLSRFGGRG